MPDARLKIAAWVSVAVLAMSIVIWVDRRTYDRWARDQQQVLDEDGRLSAPLEVSWQAVEAQQCDLTPSSFEVGILYIKIQNPKRASESGRLKFTLAPLCFCSALEPTPFIKHAYFRMLFFIKGTLFSSLMVSFCFPTDHPCAYEYTSCILLAVHSIVLLPTALLMQMRTPPKE